MPRRRSESRTATSVDAHVGQRIRSRRHEIGISQTALAERAGITFQQIQKYENGANRVSASRLWSLAAVLDVPVDYFFKGLDQHKLSAAALKQLEAGRRDNVARDEHVEEETWRLAARIARLDPALRKKLKGMISAFSGA